jgi:ribonuclease HII
MSPLPRGASLRRDAGLYARERALARHGLSPVAGIDEAGRGACAGPLVVAAVVLREGAAGEIAELADSKLLSEKTREVVYERVVKRARAWSAVVIPADEVDRVGLHVSNVAGMRRALARLGLTPGYVLTDGFPVAGLGAPGLALWKGDRVSGSIAAASVVAKVTRDRIMRDVHERFPHYDFATHKGYVTPGHQDAMARHGVCDEHRMSYVNVRRVAMGEAG